MLPTNNSATWHPPPSPYASLPQPDFTRQHVNGPQPYTALPGDGLPHHGAADFQTQGQPKHFPRGPQLPPLHSITANEVIPTHPQYAFLANLSQRSDFPSRNLPLAIRTPPQFESSSPVTAVSIPATSGLPLPPPQNLATTRYRLHVRQQPRAACAGPNSKDRQTIDPPPIVQLQLLDFRPDSEEDINDLQSTCFVTHARLISPSSPHQEFSVLPIIGEDGQRLLLGTDVSVPFFCAEDPDPNTRPGPIYSGKQGECIEVKRPSPHNSGIPASAPATFFIFADLSVRKVGEYRIEFKLMKLDFNSLVLGNQFPVLHRVTSNVFRVARDSYMVQPSTALVKGLLKAGARFSLKVKGGNVRSTKAGSSEEEGDDSNAGSSEEEGDNSNAGSSEEEGDDSNAGSSEEGGDNSNAGSSEEEGDDSNASS